MDHADSASESRNILVRFVDDDTLREVAAARLKALPIVGDDVDLPHKGGRDPGSRCTVMRRIWSIPKGGEDASMMIVVKTLTND